MLATKISFMNELSNIAEEFGADIEHVRKGIGADPRIGYQFIYPGCGYGGSCFPKDVKALISSSKAMGVRPHLLEAVEAVNEKQKNKLMLYVTEHFKDQDFSGKTVALWGLSFKPNTDDMREAPSRHVMEQLWGLGAKVQAYDPEAMKEAQRIYGDRGDLVLCKNQNECIENADFLIVCTEWKTFQNPKFEILESKLKDKVIFDGRNIYDPIAVEGHGIAYYGIGRGRSLK